MHSPRVTFRIPFSRASPASTGSQPENTTVFAVLENESCISPKSSFSFSCFHIPSSSAFREMICFPTAFRISSISFSSTVIFFRRFRWTSSSSARRSLVCSSSTQSNFARTSSRADASRFKETREILSAEPASESPACGGAMVKWGIEPRLRSSSSRLNRLTLPVLTRRYLSV